MKIRKTLAVLTALLLLISLAACQSAKTEPTADPKAADNSGIFRFEDYKSNEVFDIEKVDMSDGLAQKCTSYRFTYMSDGLKIKAYISIPVSAFYVQKPVKCLLYNHGGNRNYGKLEDDDTANLCAAIGNRIVVATQYRGVGESQGYDQFGGDDLNDVIKLIDLCENHFSFVDMDDFCVAGASRGGMMTYMAARQDSRIKRIIAMSAVSDLFQSYEIRVDMQDVMLETIGSTPQEDPKAYEKRSAICWADEIKVPVLIIHSKLDELVSYSQAEAMYEKLKDSTDCTFITYEDDVHGSHPEDFAKIREWLDRE